MKKTPSTSEKKEKYMMGMLVCMNEVKNSATKRIKTRTQTRVYPLVIWNSLWQSTNMNMKTCRIILYIIKNRKGALQIWKSALHILKALQKSPTILVSTVPVYFRRDKRVGTKITKMKIVQ